MTQDHATPVPRRPLMVVRAGTEGRPAPVPPVPAGSTGPGTEPAPVPAVPVPMTNLERGRHAVAHWAGTAAEGAGRLWLHPGRVLYVLWHGKPESMAEHRAYVKSRAWVPPELAGKPAAVITAAGIIYHLLVARPVKCAARIVDGAADRPLRLFMLAVFVIPLVFVLLNL